MNNYPWQSVESNERNMFGSARDNTVPKESRYTNLNLPRLHRAVVAVRALVLFQFQVDSESEVRLV